MSIPKIRRVLIAVVAAVLCAVVAERAGAAVISFVPVADTAIIDVTPTTNYATFNSGDYLSVFTSGNVQRSLIQFDLSTIPAGATITSAVLTLHVNPVAGSGASDENKPMEVYRVTNPWIDTQATWNNRDATHAWTSPGGDAVGTTGAANTSPYASNSNNFANTDGLPITWTVTSLINEWYTGAQANNGLLLRSYINNRLVLHSSEATTSAFRPSLDITFTPIPEPATLPAMLTAAATLLAARRR